MLPARSATMPRNTEGGYSLPSGTLVNSGDTILVSQHNPAMTDIATAIGNSLDRNGSGGMRAALNMGSNPIQNAADGSNASDLATVAQVETAGMPIGSSTNYWGQTAPAGWIFMYGQALSRSTYSKLFAVLGTTFGPGDGSTTFNIPDARGRAEAGKDDMGGVSAGRLSSPVDGSTLGAVGGSQSVTLGLNEIPAHSHTGATGNNGSHTHTVNAFLSGAGGFSQGAPVQAGTLGAGFGTSTAGEHAHSIPEQGGGAAHNNIQPTIVANKIMKTGVI